MAGRLSAFLRLTGFPDSSWLTEFVCAWVCIRHTRLMIASLD